MIDNSYRINSPSAVSEIIDGEAIIMNLKSGNYFSIESSGAILWDWIVKGHSLRSVVDLLQRDFSSGAENCDKAVVDFVNVLVKHELIVPEDSAPDLSIDDEPPADRGRFDPPAVQVFNDMQDLLLLDPIHDVDEVGWPSLADDVEKSSPT